MDLAISCKNLEKNYGSKKVLKGIDLEIPQGTIIALIGTNGAGKTTLIRTILGLIPKTQGEVRVLGQEPYSFGAQVRQRIGYVSEQQGLYGWMRVWEIIRFCKSLYLTWDDKLVENYLQLFKIQPNIKISTLSKGQQVKLALLIAMAPKPDLLILDEPMSGLDPLAQHEFLQVIMKEIHREGTTIFFSTHNLPDAMLIAQKVAIVYDGKIQAYGGISEICSLISKVSVKTLPQSLPLKSVLLTDEPDKKVLLIAADAYREIAATSEVESLSLSPASLEETFLFFCSGGDIS